MGLSGYTEDKGGEIKADRVINCPHVQKEWWDQMKGLQTD